MPGRLRRRPALSIGIPVLTHETAAMSPNLVTYITKLRLAALNGIDEEESSVLNGNGVDAEDAEERSGRGGTQRTRRNAADAEERSGRGGLPLEPATAHATNPATKKGLWS